MEQEPKPEVEQEPKPEVEQEPKPEVEQDPKPEVEQEPKGNADNEAKEDDKDKVEADADDKKVSKDDDVDETKGDVEQNVSEYDNDDANNRTDANDEVSNEHSPKSKSSTDAAIEEDDTDDVATSEEPGEHDKEANDKKDKSDNDKIQQEASDVSQEDSQQTASDDLSSSADVQDEIDYNSIDDLKSAIEDKVSSLIAAFNDPVEYGLKQEEAEIELICDLIDAFGGDTSAFREELHELINTFLDTWHGLSEEAADKAPDFFEALGERLTNPDVFHEVLNEISMERPETNDIIEEIAHSFTQGENTRVEDFPEFNLEGSSVGVDGIVDAATGDLTGGFEDDATATDFINEISNAADDFIGQEIEALGNADNSDWIEIQPMEIPTAPETDVQELQGVDVPECDAEGNVEGAPGPDADMSELTGTEEMETFLSAIL